MNVTEGGLASTWEAVSQSDLYWKNERTCINLRNE